MCLCLTVTIRSQLIYVPYQTLTAAQETLQLYSGAAAELGGATAWLMKLIYKSVAAEAKLFSFIFTSIPHDIHLHALLLKL